MPSQASDVDQFLDDLFNPVLDQLSDARSLAASIKGSSWSEDHGRRTFDEAIDGSSTTSWDVAAFARTIKGGGRGVASQQQQVRVGVVTRSVENLCGT